MLVTRTLARVCLFALAVSAGTVHVSTAPGDVLVAEAARRGDIAAVRALVEQAVDVSAPQPDGATALHWAADRDDLAVADVLLGAGARVDAVNDYGVSPLMLAATTGSVAMVTRLLDAGANPNTVLPTGETVLMRAAHTGSVASVEALASRGADLNLREHVMGQTALMWAIWQGHMDVVRALVAGGADVRAASNSGFTPLLFAVREGNLDAARVLLSEGADVNATAKDGNSALHVAVVRGHLPLAKFLLDRGADPNASGPGFAPLHWAAGTWETIHSHDYIFNQTAVNTVHEWSVLAGIPTLEAKHDLIRALLAKGGHVNARVSKPPPRFGFTLFKDRLAVGGTPFFLASLSGDVPTMKLLLANGADPSIPGADGSTPLIVAAGLGRVDKETRVPESSVLAAVELALEQQGNDLQTANEAGHTALHAATRAGLDETVRYLVGRGADINAKNKLGETPLAQAANGFEESALLVVRPSTAVVLKALGASLD